MIGGTAAGAGAVTIAPSDASGNPMVSLTASASSLAVMAGEPAGPFAIGDVNVAIPMALPDEGGNSGPAQFAAMVPEAPIGGVAAVVPEPTTWLLLVLGIGCLALARRR
jgi:hypothetical protein